MKDKFLELLRNQSVDRNEADLENDLPEELIIYSDESAEKCEQIADEYACYFAEWCSANSWIYLDYEKIWIVKGGEHEDALTTKQLLEIYKQSLKTTI